MKPFCLILYSPKMQLYYLRIQCYTNHRVYAHRDLNRYCWYHRKHWSYHAMIIINNLNLYRDVIHTPNIYYQEIKNSNQLSSYLRDIKIWAKHINAYGDQKIKKVILVARMSRTARWSRLNTALCSSLDEVESCSWNCIKCCNRSKQGT